MAVQRAGIWCEPRLYNDVEWTSELQGEHHQISSLCRRCHRYQGKWYKHRLCVPEISVTLPQRPVMNTQWMSYRIE